jgi:hypothetical protein
MAPTREEIINQASVPSILRAIIPFLLGAASPGSKFVPSAAIPPDFPSDRASRSLLLPLLGLCLRSIVEGVSESYFSTYLETHEEGVGSVFGRKIRSALLNRDPELSKILVEGVSTPTHGLFTYGILPEVTDILHFLVTNSIFCEVVDTGSVKFLVYETELGADTCMKVIPLGSGGDLFSLNELAAAGRLNLNPAVPSVFAGLPSLPHLSEYRMVSSSEGMGEGVHFHGLDPLLIHYQGSLRLRGPGAVSPGLPPHLRGARVNYGNFPVFYRGGDEVPVFSLSSD